MNRYARFQVTEVPSAIQGLSDAYGVKDTLTGQTAKTPYRTDREATEAAIKLNDEWNGWNREH